MRYPKTLYKSVLLLDGKIIGWKIVTYCWRTVGEAFHNRQCGLAIKALTEYPDRLSVDNIGKTVYNDQDNNDWFEDEEFFRQYEMHEEYPDDMFRPY